MKTTQATSKPPFNEWIAYIISQINKNKNNGIRNQNK